MPEGVAKISEDLAERMRASDKNEMLEVVVELHSPSAPTPRDRSLGAAALKTALVSRLDPIVERVTAAGGELIDAAWLNQTMMIRIPTRRIIDISSDDTVANIDLPHEARPDHIA